MSDAKQAADEALGAMTRATHAVAAALRTNIASGAMMGVAARHPAEATECLRAIRELRDVLRELEQVIQAVAPAPDSPPEVN